MKIKLIAVAVAGILLSGCNDDNGEVIGLSVQAFDPAIQYMTAVAECDNAPTETSITGYDGNAKFLTLAPLSAPETCKFTFTGEIGSGAVDVSNGKSMEGVTYTIPKGMAQANSPITASPMTTLIAKELEASGGTYSEATATTVLTSLGLGGLLNNGVSVSELLSNTEEVLKTLSPTDAGTLGATTAVLSDVLKADPSATVASISTDTANLAGDIVADNPQYPASGADGTGDDIVFEITDPKAALPAPETAVPVKPTDPPKPGTGGTGGTGAENGQELS